MQINKEKLDHHKVTDYRFVFQNIASKSILINCSDMFMYIILTLFVCLIVYIIWLFSSKKENLNGLTTKQRIKWKVINYLHECNKEFPNVWIRIGLEIYLDWLFASALNISDLTFLNSEDIYGSFVAILCFIIMLGFTAVIPWLIYFSKKDLNIVTINSSRIKLLYKNLNLKKKFSMNVHVMFIILRALLVLIVLTLHYHGWIQILIFNLVIIGLFVIRSILRPYKTVIMNCQDLIGCGLIMVLSWVYFMFLYKPLELATKGAGTLLSYIWLGIITIIILHFYVFAAIAVYLHLKKAYDIKMKELYYLRKGKVFNP